eukprot:755107-Hanusia_phi.AAC.7
MPQPHHHDDPTPTPNFRSSEVTPESAGPAGRGAERLTARRGHGRARQTAGTLTRNRTRRPRPGTRSSLEAGKLTLSLISEKPCDRDRFFSSSVVDRRRIGIGTIWH